jgi:hypothetical protein
MSSVRLVVLEAGIGLALSLGACIGVLYAIGNDGTAPILEGTSVFLMAMGIGILVWIGLLVVARRVTAARGAGPRVVASLLAAVLAILVNAVLLSIVLLAIGGQQVEFLILLVPCSFAFALAGLAANLLTHLWLGRATPRVPAATS